MTEKQGMVVSKVLSRNDTGENGSHQAGILVPKDPRILRFFPQLSSESRNPSCMLRFSGPDGRGWAFRYVYYNNALSGGTRNEYRITCMTSFMRAYELKAGDRLHFSKAGDVFSVALERALTPLTAESGRQGKNSARASWHITLTKEDMTKWKEQRQK
jgi:hypothetical protein